MNALPQADVSLAVGAEMPHCCFSHSVAAIYMNLVMRNLSLKTKVLISCAVTVQLICVFVFAYANSRNSHDMAHISRKRF